MQQRPSFESLFRLSPNAYVLLAPDLAILDANDAYLRLTGRRREEILGQRLHEAFAVDPQQPDAVNVAELLESFDRVLERRVPDTIPVIRYSISRQTERGPVFEDRYWSATHTPLLDDDGRVSAILQHTSDITELYGMQAARAAAEARKQPLQQIGQAIIARARLVQDEGNLLRRLFAQAPGFVCFLRGPEHIFELVNAEYQRLTGHRELIGRSVREALPEVDGQGFLELLDQAFASGEPIVRRQAPVRLRRDPQGPLEELFVDFLYQPITESSGRVSGIFVLGHDVTEQRRAEDEVRSYREHLEELVRERTAALLQSEAERQAAEAALLQAQKLEAVGKLTGGIAHDFNNMLQIIGGNLQLLRRSLGADETALRRLDSAVSGVDKGARLASQLLAFASRQPLRPQRVHLEQLIGDMHELLGGALGSSITVEVDVPGGLWPVHADVGNLQSVLLNLAANAREAMAGAGRLQIRLHNSTLTEKVHGEAADIAPGDYVVLSVIDEGVGMSDAVRSHAFEPFFTTKQETNASGLGLSMVYGFVKQSGGFVRLDNGEQGGTAVHVYLPRAQEASGQGSEERPAPAVVEDAVPVECANADEAGLQVLFVEDDPTLRMLTGEVMLELGHQVTLSETAEDALAQLEGGEFDVLLTDVGLHGMSGIELARRVRQHHPGVTVVIASGYAVDAREEALADVRTMLKPYDIQQVRALLEAIARERRG
ncbi:PAS domain-containing protein [Stutzerimonas balearica]|uniref:PAS domain-containing protein n=1 Tax=Stutzerimonas balearica TaxID=74829 RepID=UPI0037870900